MPTLEPIVIMDDDINTKIIQTWWEIPSITYFYKTFEKVCELGSPFNVEDLENALTLKRSSWLDDKLAALLKGCFQLPRIASKYKNPLKSIFQLNCEEQYNPYDSDIPFYLLPVRQKVDILQCLCDIRSSYLINITNMDIDALRIKPLGYDSKKNTYWYFKDTRLYQEKKTNGQKSVWKPACLNKTDWMALEEQLKISDNKAEKELYTQIQEVIPTALRLLRLNEREEHLRILRKQPKRSSRRRRTTVIHFTT